MILISSIGAVVMWFLGYSANSRLQKEKKMIDADLKKQQASIDKDLLRASGLVQKQSKALEEIHVIVFEIQDMIESSLVKPVFNSTTADYLIHLQRKWANDDSQVEKIERKIYDLKLILREKSFLFNISFLESFDGIINNAMKVAQTIKEIKKRQNKEADFIEQKIKNGSKSIENKDIRDAIKFLQIEADHSSKDFFLVFENIREEMRKISGVS